MEPNRRLRVRTGCITCRLRRIKCDETTPECRKCSSNGRQCEGYNPDLTRRQLASTVRRGANPSPSSSSTTNAPSTSLISRSSLVKVPYSSDRERFSFESFLTSAATTAQNFATPNLWRQLMPQTSHEDPTINQLVLALGMTHSHFLFCGPGSHAEDYALVKVRYGKALQTARDTTAKSSEADIPLILLASILFVTLDLQLFDFATAATHLQIGSRLAAQHRRQLELKGYKKAHNSDLTILASDALSRLDLQMCLIGWIMFHTIHPAKPLEDLEEVHGLPRYNFKSVDEARRTIVDLFRSIWRIYAVGFVQIGPNRMKKARAEDLPQGFIRERKAHYQVCLDLWRGSFDSFASSHRAKYQKASPPSQEHDADPLPLLSAYHLTAEVVLDASTMTTEMEWDRHLETFDNIVDLVESFQSILPQTLPPPLSAPCPSTTPWASPSAKSSASPSATSVPSPSATSSASHPHPTLPSAVPPPKPDITCEMGVTYPLMLVAIKCRDPLIRRKAVNLLYQSNRVEGPASSQFASGVVWKMIETEECNAYYARMGSMANLSLYDFGVQQASDVPERARVSHIRGETFNARLGIEVNCVKFEDDDSESMFHAGSIEYPNLS